MHLRERESPGNERHLDNKDNCEEGNTTCGLVGIAKSHLRADLCSC